MKHLVLFDIDGTLLRVQGAGKIAFERAFSELFNVTDVWKSLNAHGRTDRDIIDELCKLSLGRTLATDEQIELEERFVRYFGELIWVHPRFELMPGVPELLTALSEISEVVLGIETGNLESTAALKLSRGALESYFSVGGYGSDSRDRSEIVRIAIQRAQEKFLGDHSPVVTVIGDSINDVLAAHANNARAIAVATGGIGVERLRAETQAEVVSKDLADTDLILETILQC